MSGAGSLAVYRAEHRVPGELGGDDAEADAVEGGVLDLAGRDGVEDVAVDERVEGLDRACQRSVHLPAELLEHAPVEGLVRRDDGEGRVAGKRVDGPPGRDSLLDALDERPPRAGRCVEVAADDLSLAVDDGADGVHDREDGDARRPEPPERAALAAGLALAELERLADRRRATRSAGAE